MTTQLNIKQMLAQGVTEQVRDLFDVAHVSGLEVAMSEDGDALTVRDARERWIFGVARSDDGMWHTWSDVPTEG